MFGLLLCAFTWLEPPAASVTKGAIVVAPDPPEVAFAPAGRERHLQQGLLVHVVGVDVNHEDLGWWADTVPPSTAIIWGEGEGGGNVGYLMTGLAIFP